MSMPGKIKFGIPLCDECAKQRQSLIGIFNLKQSRTRGDVKCYMCPRKATAEYVGMADSDKEIELIKQKFT